MGNATSIYIQADKEAQSRGFSGEPNTRLTRNAGIDKSTRRDTKLSNETIMGVLAAARLSEVEIDERIFGMGLHAPTRLRCPTPLAAQGKEATIWKREKFHAG